MARDGSGNFSLVAGNPVVNGTTISSTVQNNTMSDVATALTASLCADGQKTATANQPMGSFKHTSVGDATARTHYGAAGQIQDGALITVGSVAGTDTYTGSLSPAHVSFTAGQTIIFKPGSTNTGASTLALNGGTAKSITKNSVALVAGDLVSGTPAILVYTGTAWNLTNPYGAALSSIFLAGDGAVGAPSFSFTSDPDTGMWHAAANQLAWSVAGATAMVLDAAQLFTASAIQFRAGEGAVGTPVYSFDSDRDTGIYHPGANNLAFVVGGATFLSIDGTPSFAINSGATGGAGTFNSTAANGLYLTFSRSGAAKADIGNAGQMGNTLDAFGIATRGTQSIQFITGGSTKRGEINDVGQYLASDGAVGTPGLSFINDPNTGLYRIGADSFGITAGGVLQFWVDNTNSVPVRSELVHGFNVGSVSNPGITWAVDNDTGIYHRTGNAITFTANGTLAMEVQNAATYFLDGSVGLPGIAFFNDADNGLYRIGTNDWGLSAAGALVLEILSGQAKYLTFEVGFREIPQNSQSVNYTLVLADSGKHIYHPSGGGAGDTFTIPANSSVAYALGTALTFVNGDSNAVSIAITTDTMTLAGTTTTGTRTLGQNGVATAIKTTATTWIISGTGLT